MLTLLSKADRMLGRLDGVTSTLPNPDLFVAMFVRQEAVLSSQIEGTQSTLEDVIQERVSSKGLPGDMGEVVNYVRAMNEGLDALASSDGLPLGLRLLREWHAVLMDSVRGQNRAPGEFRTTQNWTGPPGASLASAHSGERGSPDRQGKRILASDSRSMPLDLHKMNPSISVAPNLPRQEGPRTLRVSLAVNT